MSGVQKALQQAMEIGGAVGVALVDHTSGMCLGQEGGGLGLGAAAGNTAAVRAKLETMDSLKLRDGIEDVLVTLPGEYHLIRSVAGRGHLALYLALDRDRAHLGLARNQLERIERDLTV